MKLGELVCIRTGRLDANQAVENGRYPFFTCAADPLRIDAWQYDCECVLVAGNCNPYVSYYNGKFNAYQRVYIIEVQEEDRLYAKYLYYFLKLYMERSTDRQHGAIEKFFHLSDFTEIDIDFPSVEEQRLVADSLWTIDRKIALNRKRIATLEAMAKEIYDYWFVQFDFPDAHGRPYKSSGGAMVYNPDLKREIPKGWEVKSINDCGEFFRGVAYSHEDEKQCGENVVLVMRGNNIKSGHIVDDSDRVFIDKAIVGQDQLMTKFSVLFAMSSGSKEHVGKTAVYYDYPAMAAYGAFCSKYVPSDSYRYFMFNFLSSSTYRAFVKRICGGTGINNMKEEYFNVPLFALPGDIGQVRKFNELTATIYAQVYNCTQEMSKLMSLRDFLLPLLMNGQVKVA